MAYKLGKYVSKFKWFGGFYILYAFIIFPAISLGFSYLFSINTVALVFGILLQLIFTALSLLFFRKFEIFGNKIEMYIKNRRKNIEKNDSFNIEMQATKKNIEII